MHGQPIVGILACWTGDPEMGEHMVAPIKAFGNPVGDILVRRPYAQLQSLLDGTQPKGRRYYWKSEYLAGIDDALCERYMAQAAKIPSPHSAVIFFQLGGALNERAADEALVGNRDARYVLNVAGSGRTRPTTTRTSAGCAGRGRTCGRSRRAARTRTS
ncbi:MAG: hypothetical protein U0470_05250 [Anaerolineae bacterium]